MKTATIRQLVLAGVLAAGATSAAGADIIFDCAAIFSIPRGYLSCVGHLYSLKIGNTAAAADIATTDPAGAAGKVAGVVTKFQWTGQSVDPIRFTAQISNSNRQTLALLLQKQLSNTAVEAKFRIYAYDPLAKKYIVAISGAGDAVLKGQLAQAGGKLDISFASTPSPGTPQTWALTFSAAPTSAQSVYYAIADQKSVVKIWGVAAVK